MSPPITPLADRLQDRPVLGPILGLLIRLLRIGRIQTRLMAAEDRVAALGADLERTRIELERTRTELRSDIQREWRADLESFRGEAGHIFANFRAEFKAALARDSRALERAIAIAARSRAASEFPESRLAHPDFYVKFEDAFRGRWKVEERMRWYASYLRPLLSRDFPKPFLDIGCGRGEWLLELQRSGVVAAGIDLNPAMVEAARAQGLSVTLGEAVAHLRDREGGSLGGVSCFHVVEHMEFSHVLRFFEAAHHALAPGGVLAVETPNPESIAVGAFSFWYDPTHLRPLPPALLKFYVEAAGFEDVKIVRFFVKPDAPDRATIDEPVAPSLEGPLDYAIVARKPAV